MTAENVHLTFEERQRLEIVEGLRDRAHDLATGIMMSEVKEQVEWRGADLIEELLSEAEASADMIRTLSEDAQRYEKWVNDLQSGMYVNCVYCGHRYGPGETTPVSMADALKEHIAQCPKHPMSALQSQLSEARELLERFSDCEGRGGMTDYEFSKLVLTESNAFLSRTPTHEQDKADG